MTDRAAKRERALEFIRVDICTAIENGAVDDEIRAVVETAIADAIRSLA